MGEAAELAKDRAVDGTNSAGEKVVEMTDGGASKVAETGEAGYLGRGQGDRAERQR
jgi:hypothetical protein